MIRNLALILVIQAATAWAQYTCPDAGLFCASCTSLAICTGAGAAGKQVDCQSGQLCGVSGSFASCYSNTATESSACQCESSGGYLVDPYLPSQYFLCLPGGDQVPLTCGTDESFDPDQNSCTVMPTITTPTPPSCLAIGFFAVSCTSYYACTSASGDGTVYECPSGQYFHEIKGVCVPPEDLSPAPFSCGSDDGAFGDTVDCSIFYVCSGGNQVGSPITCPSGTIFDSDLGFCSSGTCDIEVSVCATSVSLASTSPTSPTTSSSSTTSSSTSTPSSTSTSTPSSTSTSTPSSTSSSTPSSTSSSTPSSTSSSSTSSSSSSTSSPSTSASSTSTLTPTSKSTSTTSYTTSSTTSSELPTTSTTTTSTATSSTSTSTTTTPTTTTSTSTTTTPTTTTSTSTTTTPTTTASTSTATTSTTTAYVTPTCSSDGDSFPYPGDCTRFYSCVKGELEVYACTGSLVYSPTLGYCTLLANVPECS